MISSFITLFVPKYFSWLTFNIDFRNLTHWRTLYEIIILRDSQPIFGRGDNFYFFWEIIPSNWDFSCWFVRFKKLISSPCFFSSACFCSWALFSTIWQVIFKSETWVRQNIKSVQLSKSSSQWCQFYLFLQSSLLLLQLGNVVFHVCLPLFCL